MKSNLMHVIQILLVEDNINDAELTTRALKKSKISESINIIHVKDGEEAIDYFFNKDGTYKNLTELPKVILLDLKLPKIDGVQVLQKLKSNAHTKLIPVVVLTSSHEEKDIIESYKLGVNSYVTKPVEFEQFMESVANLGTYWGRSNESPER
jgi:two-component system response regulator